ncbi:hypothetical protein Tbd_1691 [Thiobacillus denitrificans ATCC 25259]|uniref:Uncharacterized protein n=1 Tax=Thiobacillus denitrificans (strain ATCC 25259 / T1) TaxID=292415 RepID=Q3SI84_THIDA|nr:hypothetical protein Tbd_1691 [Thiobacillus denitrificans ATCC 25259]
MAKNRRGGEDRASTGIARRVSKTQHRKNNFSVAPLLSCKRRFSRQPKSGPRAATIPMLTVLARVHAKAQSLDGMARGRLARALANDACTASICWRRFSHMRCGAGQCAPIVAFADQAEMLPIRLRTACAVASMLAGHGSIASACIGAGRWPAGKPQGLQKHPAPLGVGCDISFAFDFDFALPAPKGRGGVGVLPGMSGLQEVG